MRDEALVSFLTIGLMMNVSQGKARAIDAIATAKTQAIHEIGFDAGKKDLMNTSTSTCIRYTA